MVQIECFVNSERERDYIEVALKLNGKIWPDLRATEIRKNDKLNITVIKHLLIGPAIIHLLALLEVRYPVSPSLPRSCMVLALKVSCPRKSS